MEKVTNYKQRDTYDLDCENGSDKSYYADHVFAITAEGLHGKSDIAAELAVRDAQIDYLLREVESHTGVSSEFLRGRLPQFKIGEQHG